MAATSKRAAAPGPPYVFDKQWLGGTLTLALTWSASTNDSSPVIEPAPGLMASIGFEISW